MGSFNPQLKDSRYKCESPSTIFKNKNHVVEDIEIS